MAFVTKQDPMGLSQDRPLPHILCFSPSLKYLDNITVTDAHFLSCFTDAKNPTKWKTLTTWWPWACSLQAYWGLMSDNVNLSHTSLLPHHQPVRELCTNPGTPLPHLAFKNAFLKPTKEFLVFWALAAWTPPLVPCNKHCTFLHHNLVSVDWLYWRQVSRPKFGLVTTSSSGSSFYSVYFLNGTYHWVYLCYLFMFYLFCFLNSNSILREGDHLSAVVKQHWPWNHTPSDGTRTLSLWLRTGLEPRCASAGTQTHNLPTETETTQLRWDLNPCARTGTQPEPRLGLEPTVFSPRSHTWSQDLMKFRFFTSQRIQWQTKW